MSARTIAKAPSRNPSDSNLATLELYTGCLCLQKMGVNSCSALRTMPIVGGNDVSAFVEAFGAPSAYLFCSPTNRARHIYSLVVVGYVFQWLLEENE